MSREQTDSRKQVDQDRRALRTQMEALEAELQEQLSRQRACAEQAGELCALRQQLTGLDKQLRNQRHFMDVRVLSGLCGHWRSSLDGRPQATSHALCSQRTLAVQWLWLLLVDRADCGPVMREPQGVA